MNSAKVEPGLAPTHLANEGRIVIIGTQPLLDPYIDSNNQKQMIVYGRQGLSYSMQYVTNVMDTNWLLRSRIVMTNIFRPFSPGSSPAPPVYWRARQ